MIMRRPGPWSVRAGRTPDRRGGPAEPARARRHDGPAVARPVQPPVRPVDQASFPGGLAAPLTRTVSSTDGAGREPPALLPGSPGAAGSPLAGPPFPTARPFPLRPPVVVSSAGAPWRGAELPFPVPRAFPCAPPARSSLVGRARRGPSSPAAPPGPRRRVWRRGRPGHLRRRWHRRGRRCPPPPRGPVCCRRTGRPRGARPAVGSTHRRRTDRAPPFRRACGPVGRRRSRGAVRRRRRNRSADGRGPSPGASEGEVRGAPDPGALPLAPRPLGRRRSGRRRSRCRRSGRRRSGSCARGPPRRAAPRLPGRPSPAVVAGVTAVPARALVPPCCGELSRDAGSPVCAARGATWAVSSAPEESSGRGWGTGRGRGAGSSPDPRGGAPRGTARHRGRREQRVGRHVVLRGARRVDALRRRRRWSRRRFPGRPLHASGLLGVGPALRDARVRTVRARTPRERLRPRSPRAGRLLIARSDVVGPGVVRPDVVGLGVVGPGVVRPGVVLLRPVGLGRGRRGEPCAGGSCGVGPAS